MIDASISQGVDFNEASLHLNVGYLRQVLERDRRGELIHDNAATSLNVAVTNEIRWLLGAVPFTVVVRVPKSAAVQRNDADTLALAWLAAHLPAMLSKSNYWNWFESLWMDWTSAPAESAAELQALTLSAPLQASLRETNAHLHSVRKRFDEAEERLQGWVRTDYPANFAMTLGQARSELATLRSIVSCSADTGSTLPEHVDRARRDYEELARRKNANNRNFRVHLQDLQRFVYMLTFPSSWGRKPLL